MALYSLKNRAVYQVSYFIFAVIEVLLLSGITYGWASIEFVFEQEGFFGYLCPSGHSLSPTNTTKPTGTSMNSSNHSKFYRKVICSSQRRRFNLVFNVALAFLCGFKLPIGLFVDKFGPRAAQILGCVLYVAAGLGLAFVTRGTADILFPVFILFSIGGGFIAVAKYQVTRIIYKNVRSLTLSVLHGTFDSSAVVLVFFKLAWEAGISLRYISLFYTVCSMVIVAISTTLLTPPYSKLLDEAIANEPTKKQSPEKDEIEESIISDQLVPDTLLKSIFSARYLLELMYLAFTQLRLWFFIGSLNELVSSVHPNDRKIVDNYTSYFGYAQFCGILIGPIIGFIFDRNTFKNAFRSKKTIEADKSPLIRSKNRNFIERLEETILPFFLTNLMCVAMSLLVLAKWNIGLITSFVLHVVTRGFLYSSHGAYIGLAFRPERFGTLYGLGIFISGIFGLLEYPLYTLTDKVFSTDPFWVNFMLLFLVLASDAFPFYLLYFCKRAKKLYGSKPSVQVHFEPNENRIHVQA